MEQNKITVWEKMGDHPKVWADYDSSCGGDTDNGKFFITSGKEHIEVFRGSIIFEMPDGTYIVTNT